MSRLRRWKRGEFACGEIFQGAKTAVEFCGREAPQAVESAQKIRDRTVALARVAFDTRGNQVAVGVASEAHAWHDVVEALHVGGSAAEAVKAGAAFAIVNGFAERPGFQEIGGLEGRGGRISTRWPVLLRSSKRKAPSSSRRRTAWRTGPLDRPRSRATDITAKCRRSLPTTREWRSK